MRSRIKTLVQECTRAAQRAEPSRHPRGERTGVAGIYHHRNRGSISAVGVGAGWRRAICMGAVSARKREQGGHDGRAPERDCPRRAHRFPLPW